MSGLRVLISGGGIAGPTAAYFLAKYGADVTIVERASSIRTAGQNIDIRGEAIKVIRAMGLEDEIRRHHTTEEGMTWVDSNNKSYAPFPSTSDASSFTAEIEILRSDLARILYDATKSKVKWVFGDYITAINQLGDKAGVTMAKGGVQTYDIVIAADGLGSKTRALAIPEFGEQWIKRTGMYMAFFSVPKGPTDTKWCRWYTPPGRRSIMARPAQGGLAKMVLACMNGDSRLEEVLGQSTRDQKALMRDLFKDVGWEIDRILAGMDDTDDFYMDKTAQIKMPFWSRGRVVLLGDAGFGPSPITGMGTSTALIAAYVLAGEIASSKRPEDAFASYEKVLRPFVVRAQQIPPGAPGIIHPESTFGVKILENVLWFASISLVRRAAMMFSGSPSETFKLPDYSTANA